MTIEPAGVPSLIDQFLAAGMHFRIINFSIFVALLVYFLRKPLREFWISRASEVSRDIDESAVLLKNAEEKNKFLTQRVADLENEVTRLIKNLDEEGELEKKKMQEDADKMVMRIKQDAQKIAEQEVRRAREGLKAEAVNLAVNLAEKIIREKIQDQDQVKLTTKYLSQLAQLAELEKGL